MQVQEATAAHVPGHNNHMHTGTRRLLRVASGAISVQYCEALLFPNSLLSNIDTYYEPWSMG
jgi:hypothetical protein